MPQLFCVPENHLCRSKFKIFVIAIHKIHKLWLFKILVWDNEKKRVIATASDTPGVFICRCNMQHLNPTSDILTEKDLLFLEAQGAIISALDTTNAVSEPLPFIPQNITKGSE